MKRFLVTTALVAATTIPFGLSAYAQSADPSTQTPAPVVTPAPTQQNNAPADTTQVPSVPSAQAPAASPDATATTQTPPPGDAIIAAQGSSDLRADKLIGMKVYNPDGQEVAKVKDVLFDSNGNVKGVVLNVGGVLGIGAKPVGLQWKELDVQPSNNVVKVNYTKEQLEAAPTFQPQDAAANTTEPAQPAMPSPSGSAPSPSTAPSN